MGQSNATQCPVEKEGSWIRLKVYFIRGFTLPIQCVLLIAAVTSATQHFAGWTLHTQ